MADADRATCPRCRAPLLADDPPGLCPRCLLSDTQADKTEIPPISPSSSEPAPLKLTLTLASAAWFIAAVLFGGLWFGNRQGQQQADAQALFNRGVDLESLGKREEAVAAYREAIRIEPELAEAHYNLGNALDDQGKLEQAVAEYRTAIRIKPDLMEAHYNLGLLLFGQGKSEEAIPLFRDASRLKPDDPEAHDYLAFALVLATKRPRHDYDEGLVHARKAVELAPKEEHTYRTLAIAEYRSGHWAESLAASERSTALVKGGDANDWFLIALADWQRGEEDKARTWFDKAVAWMREQDAEDPILRQLWTEAAELLGRPQPDSAGAGSPATPAAEKPR